MRGHAGLLAAALFFNSLPLGAQGHGSGGHGGGSAPGGFGSIGSSSTTGHHAGFSRSGKGSKLRSPFGELPRRPVTGGPFTRAVTSFGGALDMGWNYPSLGCDPIWNCWPRPTPKPQQGEIEQPTRPAESAVSSQAKKSIGPGPSLGELARLLKAEHIQNQKPSRVYTNDDIPPAKNNI